MSNRKMKRTKAVWESDQPIVVGYDEGADSYISQEQRHAPNEVGSDPA